MPSETETSYHGLTCLFFKKIHMQRDMGSGNRLSPSMYSRFRHCFAIPSVHAESPPDVPPATHSSAGLPGVISKWSNMHLQHDKENNIASEVEVQQYLAQETGMERLRKMYGKNIYGARSDTLQIIQGMVVQGCVMTFFGAALISRYHTQQTFMEVHQATKFESRFIATRKLYDRIFTEAIKAGFKWTFKIGVFTSVFMLTSQSIATYRNKTNPLDYAAGLAFTGAIFKANMGFKGMFGSAVISFCLGAAGGSLIYALQRGTGLTQEERHLHEIKEEIQEKRRYEVEQARINSLVAETQKEQLIKTVLPSAS